MSSEGCTVAHTMPYCSFPDEILFYALFFFVVVVVVAFVFSNPLSLFSVACWNID